MHLLVSLQWGKNELLNAILGGEVECVKVLLDGGVQVNVQNEVSAV